MPILINKHNAQIEVSGKTLKELEDFFTDLEEAHIHPNPEKMATLYDKNVCAIETSLEFQGLDHVVSGLKYLFELVEFMSFDGELKSAGESNEVVWVYINYSSTQMRTKADRKSWKALNTRCTYVLKKTSEGLRILQNHCSAQVKYS